MIHIPESASFNLEKLREIMVPERPSRRWAPIPHDEFVSCILSKLGDFEFEILDNRWSVSNYGNDLHGYVDTSGIIELPDGITPSLFAMHSNDGSFGIHFYLGYRKDGYGVYLRSLGDPKRHTMRVDFPQLVEDTIVDYSRSESAILLDQAEVRMMVPFHGVVANLNLMATRRHISYKYVKKIVARLNALESVSQYSSCYGGDIMMAVSQTISNASAAMQFSILKEIRNGIV